MQSRKIPSYRMNSGRRSDAAISASSRNVPNVPWSRSLLYDYVTWLLASTKERSGLRGGKASDRPNMKKAHQARFRQGVMADVRYVVTLTIAV